MRLAHYFLGYVDAVWSLLYSDDGKITGRTQNPERGILLHLLVLVLIRLPISWKKVRGGPEVEWIGYLVDVGRFELGITASRAAWINRWLTDKVAEGRMQLGELREGLGRIGFAAGPIEHIRPFLGPLYAWASAGPRFARPKLPIMILLIMKYLAAEILDFHMVPCEARTRDLGEVFRLDAKAEGDTVAIGGWRVKGNAGARNAEWFAVSLTRKTAPWAFARGEPFRTIAALELLGVLVGLMVLVPEGTYRGELAGLITLSCGTDNQSNSYLLDKMLTTKYPLGVILMELAHQMRRRRLVLRARWLPRLQNDEADQLTNMDFRHFDKKKRIPVDLSRLGFQVLPELFKAGEDYLEILNQMKADAKESEGIGRAKKRLRGDKGLKESDPW